MTDIQSRPFSKNYSGLINQSVIATGITLLCVAGHEFLKRKRRGKGLYDPSPGLGSRETWACGYLYQARSWARFPPPPLPAGWPLSWVKPAIDFPEDQLRELRGIDATIYVRFLRGCFWYALTHLLTTFPILFPIHIDFSDASVSPKSMTRASISSLVGTAKGRSLLWIHISLLFWLTLSWIAVLLWICHGAFKMRAANIEDAARNTRTWDLPSDETKAYHPHPLRQYAFTDIPSGERDRPVPGLRSRTIMITNIPQALRTEKDLRDYFEYYMSRKVERPAVGITSSSQPGFINKSLAFLLNRAKRIQEYFPQQTTPVTDHGEEKGAENGIGVSDIGAHPIIERVLIARKMTELASLLERRERILVHLEDAHIKLASKALLAVKIALEGKPPSLASPKAAEVAKKRRSLAADKPQMDESVVDEHEAMERLVEVLRPFVEEFGRERNRSKKPVSSTCLPKFQRLPTRVPSEEDDCDPVTSANYPTSAGHRTTNEQQTIWEALLSLPRSTLDAYQPLVHLNHIFSGKIVPSIDYYTAKLNLLSSLVTENRAKHATDFDPTSTAFVTFADPTDARRACKYLAVHPNNPLVCLVTMAPMYSDIDWQRVMKASLKVEFVKDWVVSLGVWAFTIFWIFPLSLLVGLVSIQNISLFWPTLKQYLDRNPDKSEVLQSLIPTLLVSLLSLLIPPILLLIAKKFHLITTTSVLHDMLLTRYYKFLIVNVLVFFCVGNAAMQSLLQSLTSSNRKGVIQIVADSFPTAGPFYVGWRLTVIFSTALHAGIELSLIGVPLIRHIFCARQTTPRKRFIYLRPPRPNYYYWFPNHCLVLHVLLLFSVLNPLVLPFGTLYFFVQTGVMKNQLIHVYSKNFEGDGKLLLIRIVRYGLDGLILSQAIFLAYMVVLRKSVNAGLAAFLICLTVLVKIILTRMCRARFELDDASEADAICNGRPRQPSSSDQRANESMGLTGETLGQRRQYYTPPRKSSFLPVRLPDWVNFSYATFDGRHGIRRHRSQHRPPNPFGPHRNSDPTVPPAMYHQKHEGPGEGLLDQEKEGSLIVTEDSPTYHLDDPREDIIRRAKRPTNTPMHQETRLVVPHPALAPWDDQHFPDLPYDNPFYSRAIDDALWLPRNPLGFLDLDDTVDLRVSIAVDQSASRLGSWIGFDGRPAAAEGVTGTPASDATTPPGAGFSSTATHLPIDVQDVDGTEEIALPPTIAQRVQAGERDVEHLTRPRRMSLPHRSSSGDHSVRSTGRSTLRRPSILDFSPPALFRSPSAFSQGRARSGSLMSTLQESSSPGLLEKGKSAERGLRPDAHAQADFVAANASSASRVSLTSRPGLPRTQTISAAQAIFQEVLEEEREALNDRLEEETAEVEAELRKEKSWFSWLYWRSE